MPTPREIFRDQQQYEGAFLAECLAILKKGISRGYNPDEAMLIPIHGDTRWWCDGGKTIGPNSVRVYNFCPRGPVLSKLLAKLREDGWKAKVVRRRCFLFFSREFIRLETEDNQFAMEAYEE
ncbi:MAG: hypothetical protein ACXQTL_08655 [Methanosarcinales archaeon]